MQQPLYKIFFILVCPIIYSLFFAGYAGAFWFSGESKKKYEADIKEIKNDYDKPDCFNVIKKINKFLENKPPSHFKEEAYLYLGSCYEKRNEIDRALDIYGLANTLYPDSKFFRESLANIYLNAGFFEKSLALFSELAEKTDSSDKIYAGLAKSYASLGFYEKAEDNYAKALEMNGHEDLDLIKEYSRQLILARHYEKILAIFEKTSDEFKKDEEAQLILSRVWMHKGEYKKSLVYINAAQKIAPNRRDMALYAVFLNIMITDYDTALSKINCLTKNNKKDSLALLARAIVSLKKGNKKKSSEILRGILKNKTSFVSQIAAAMLKARRSQK